MNASHHRARAPQAALAAALITAALSACASSGATAAERRPASDRDRATTSVSTISEKEIATMRVGRVEELLMGRVAGLEVMRDASGDYRLRIRGQRSLLGGDEPLVRVDGMPIGAGGLSRALTGVSPSDVARIEVLKDAGATAFYGLRGANGVILITTRRR